MVFYVYMHPEVFKDAAAAAPYGMQALIGILRGFLQNCCIAEFDDGRTHQEIGKYIKDLPQDFDRSILKKLLVQLEKQNRFIYCLKPDYTDEKSDLECVVQQADVELVQLVLTGSDHVIDHEEAEFELAKLDTYNHTEFEEERSKMASDGSTTPDDYLPNTEFMDRHFLRALKHAGSIELCDRLAGTKFGDNFEYTIRAFISWLGSSLADPSGCILGFHLGQADGYKSTYIQRELSNYKRQSLHESTNIAVHYYSDLPHQRYIITNQFALEIDRGLDFLNRATRKNRNSSINLKSRKEIQLRLDAYRDQLINSEVIGLHEE